MSGEGISQLGRNDGGVLGFGVLVRDGGEETLHEAEQGGPRGPLWQRLAVGEEGPIGGLQVVAAVAATANLSARLEGWLVAEQVP